MLVLDECIGFISRMREWDTVPNEWPHERITPVYSILECRETGLTSRQVDATSVKLWPFKTPSLQYLMSPSIRRSSMTPSTTRGCMPDNLLGQQHRDSPKRPHAAPSPPSCRTQLLNATCALGAP